MHIMRPARIAVLFSISFAGATSAAVGEGHLFAGIVHQTPYFGSLVSYATPNGQTDAMTAYNRAAMIMPIACTAGSLKVQLSSVDAAYASATATLMLNGADTALTCSLAGMSSSCNDSVHTVVLAAGDTVALKVSPALPSRPISNVDTDIEVRLPFSWRCVE